MNNKVIKKIITIKLLCDFIIYVMKYMGHLMMLSSFWNLTAQTPFTFIGQNMLKKKITFHFIQNIRRIIMIFIFNKLPD